MAGPPPVHLRRAGDGVLDLPDAAELVVVEHADGLADEPAVADVVLLLAVQADDPVAVRGQVGVDVPAEPVPVLGKDRGQRQLHSGVPGRPDVLQDAGVAGGGGELAIHDQIGGVGAVVIDRARQAVVARGELEPHIQLGRLLPPQIRVGQPPGTEAHRGLVQERVHRAGE